MSTKLAKARLAVASARQVARDTKASTKPLKAENRRLRNALFKIAKLYAEEEAGRIALEALSPDEGKHPLKPQITTREDQPNRLWSCLPGRGSV